MFNFYVTGCNSGLGKGIVTQFDDKDTFTAICREKVSIPGSRFIQLDLSNMKDVEAFKFDIMNNNKINILFNNAGSLGELNQFMELDSKHMITTFNINFLSPAILMIKFIKKNKELYNNFLVVNIVSGISKLRLPFLSIYATSKSALFNLTKQVNLEFEELNMENASIITIDPGMVDTNMQRKLRSSGYMFSNYFIKRYRQFGLNSAENVSAKIISFIKQGNWESGKNYHYSDL